MTPTKQQKPRNVLIEPASPAPPSLPSSSLSPLITIETLGALIREGSSTPGLPEHLQRMQTSVNMIQFMVRCCFSAKGGVVGGGVLKRRAGDGISEKRERASDMQTLPSAVSHSLFIRQPLCWPVYDSLAFILFI